MCNEIVSISGLKQHYANLFIPSLQREYVWGRKQWECLWQDILSVCRASANEKNAQLFLGNITLKLKKNPDSYEVIGGQQRLTTITILLDMLLDLQKFYNKKISENSESYFQIGDCRAPRSDNKDIISEDGGKKRPILISMKKQENDTGESEELKKKWKDILKFISDGKLPPQYDGDTDHISASASEFL